MLLNCTGSDILGAKISSSLETCVDHILDIRVLYCIFDLSIYRVFELSIYCVFELSIVLYLELPSGRLNQCSTGPSLIGNAN